MRLIFLRVCFLPLQTDRYEEYPKLKELVQRKDELVSMRATPPYYLKASNPPISLAALGYFAREIVNKHG